MGKEESDKGRLGFITILLITINSIMGTGIFFLPAIGAREAGLFSIISWIIMGIIAIYFSTIFAELVGMFPKEGGVYEYAKEAFGQFPSFILGWMTLIAANVTIAMLIVGAIKYIGPILPESFLILFSLAFVIIFNYIAYRGLKTGAVMLVVFAFITLIAMFGIIVPGFLHFNVANFTGWTNTFPGFSPVAILSVIMFTVFMIAETFFGWETSTFLAEKVKNPRKVMPRVMILATIIIGIIVLLFVLASLSLIPAVVFGQSVAPLADLASVIYGASIVPYYSILVYLAIIGSVAGWIVASPNLLVALAKDKLFLSQLAHKHKKLGTPYKAILFQTVLTSILVLVGSGNYEALLELLVPLVLVLYISVVVALLVLRKRKDVVRPYKAPFGTVGPILLIGFVLFLIYMWASTQAGAIDTLRTMFSFILFGVPIYLLLVAFYDSHVTIKFQNGTALAFLFFEKLFFPKHIRKKLLAEALVSDKVVLELGAASGLLSKHIHNLHPKKHIIIEQSLSMKNIISRRMRYHENVDIWHDEYLTSRIHPDLTFVEEVFSIGILGNLNDECRYLKELARIMPENSRIHFFDYVDMYKFIPNKEIFTDYEKLEKIFRDAGFVVRIRKHKGLLWNYLIIDGIRSKKKDFVYI